MHKSPTKVGQPRLTIVSRKPGVFIKTAYSENNNANDKENNDNNNNDNNNNNNNNNNSNNNNSNNNNKNNNYGTVISLWISLT